MAAISLDEALIRTLAVRKRLPQGKLVLFTQLRFTRETKAADEPSEEAVLAVLARAITAGRREPKLVSFLALAFDDLDAVLDETNGLIEAQHVITTAGPMFLAWNKRLLAPDGSEISVFTKF